MLDRAPYPRAADPNAAADGSGEFSASDRPKTMATRPSDTGGAISRFGGDSALRTLLPAYPSAGFRSRVSVARPNYRSRLSYPPKNQAVVHLDVETTVRGVVRQAEATIGNARARDEALIFSCTTDSMNVDSQSSKATERFEVWPF